MRKIVFVLAWLVMPLFSNAETRNDIFRKLPSWQAVKEQAAREGKNIFIDFMATWCAPCKEMDATVYTDSTIKALIDDRYLAIKVQMDQTKNDAPDIVTWYSDADKLGKQYNITAYPTYAFLSPKGEVLGMGFGYLPVPEFTKLLKKVSRPDDAYYLQVNRYINRQMDQRDYLALAIRAKEYKDDSLAKRIVSQYKAQYFDKLSLDSQVTKNFTDLAFHFPNTIKESDKVIRYIYNHQNLLDSTFRPNISKEYLAFFVNRDYVAPITSKADELNKQPDWTAIEKALTKRYDAVMAREITFDNRLNWYYRKQDWENVIKYEIEKVEQKGIERAVDASTLQVNNLVYDLIFKKTSNPIYLKKGLKFMEVILKKSPGDDEVLDTYANVLYKIGRKQEAIQHEKKALSLAQEKSKGRNAKIYAEILDLMYADKPTWK